MLTVFGGEAEATWAAPAHRPGHCSSQGPHTREAHPAKNVVEMHWSSWEAKGDFGGVGSQLSLAPSATQWQDTLPAVHSSFRQGQSVMCSREE